MITGKYLAELWSSAIIFAPHLAGCACNGGFHIPLDPAAVEQDLIDFLQYRYQEGKRAELADFVASRQEGGGQVNFRDWLQSLDDAPLNAGDRQTLIDDLHTTLASMNEMGASQSGDFVCY